MILLLAALAFADPPPCSYPDGRAGLCYDRELLQARALTRASLDRCEQLREVDAERIEVANASAVQARQAAAESEAMAARVRRRRWRWAALGAAGGVASSGVVVWAGVQVVGAR